MNNIQKFAIISGDYIIVNANKVKFIFVISGTWKII